MLVIEPQGKIVKRIVRTRAGVLVCATFFVVERDGELQVRLLNVAPVGKADRGQIADCRFRHEALRLPASRQKSSPVTSYKHNYRSVASPFFNALEFFVSQPTRAPSRV